MDQKNLGRYSSLASLDEKISIKLKTRQFLQKNEDGKKMDETRVPQFVRCLRCSSTMTADEAVQNYDEVIHLSAYEPQDKQSLMAKFCEILKIIPGIQEEILG